MSDAKPDAEADERGVFTHGSTMRHVLVMSSTGAVGLIAIFVVDLANLFYISLLGQQELAAAIGYAATIMFFSVSICIGLSIGATAVTARALGASDVAGAHRNASSCLLIVTVLTTLFTVALFPALRPILELLGATGRTLEIALGYMQIVTPSVPLMGIGMCCAGLLRAKGDARRAMYVTLSAGAATAVIDPILIFGLELGVNGAAISAFIVRVMFAVVGLNGVWRVHQMLAWPSLFHLQRVMRPFAVIAVPAVLTQIATPVGNAYVTRAIAEFGDDAVAGWAIVGRVIPLVFAGIFSLSGAIGPILSQNYGAGRMDRVSAAMRDSLIAAAAYVLGMWAILAIFNAQLVAVFGATGDAAALVRFFCLVVAGSFLFNGALFVANAAFNNLGYPVLSTFFNWGRATIGIIPFVIIGKAWGPEGVLAGWGIGGVAFGTLAVIVCFRVLRRLPERAEREGIVIATPPAANSPFTSGKGSL